MFNVQCSMFQCRKRQRGCANTNLDGKRFVALGKHGIHCRRPPKLKIQNGDDDTNLFICSFVAFCILTSSLLILPFQIGCTYVLLSGTRVNVFHFHVARNHCSSIRSLGHVCDTTSKSCWNINFNILNKP